MGALKAKWKRAPIDQRRVSSERSTPKARFTRSQRAGSLPPPLSSGGRRGGSRPLLVFAGALILMVSVSVTLVIGVGAAIRSQQQMDDMQWRAAYYGRPTQPFSTLVPEVVRQEVGTTSPLLTTPLPGIASAVLSVSSSEGALTEPDGSATGDDKTLSSFCDQFGVPTSIRIFDWSDWSTVNLSNPLVAQLPLRWDASASFWRGYQYAKAFDIPDDSRDRWKLQLFTADGTERWIQIGESASTPEILYAYAFQVLTPFTDKQGAHYGYHPCRAFTIPYTDMAILISSARAYQSSGSRFPEFAASGDSRWVRGSATAVNASFDLRSIPTVSNNEPLKTISGSVTCYFITNVDWGAWAQIRVGSTTAWVDTSTVKLENAS